MWNGGPWKDWIAKRIHEAKWKDEDMLYCLVLIHEIDDPGNRHGHNELTWLDNLCKPSYKHRTKGNETSKSNENSWLRLIASLQHWEFMECHNLPLSFSFLYSSPD
jgi:hypothetical protein